MSGVIIIGAGPAGVSAALYTSRAGIETTVISCGDGSLGKAHEIQNYYGFSEPVSGNKLLHDGIEGAKKVGVNFINEEVTSISFEDTFVVETVGGCYKAEQIVIATGSTRNSPKIKNLKEFEGKGVSYCAICDAFFYRNKNTAVLGNGEFALHEINDLLPLAASVTLVTNGSDVSMVFPENVTVITSRIAELKGDGKFEKIIFEDGTELEMDGLFVAMGVADSTSFARKIGAVIENGHIYTDENMQTTVPGLYAAGDCTGGMLQIAKAVYEGAVAGIDIVKIRKMRNDI